MTITSWPRTVWPYCVGLAVWGGSVAVMVHGLYHGAWYGYSFALVLLWELGTILCLVVRVSRQGHREMRRLIDGSRE